MAWSFLPHAGLETKTTFPTLTTYTLVLTAFGEYTGPRPPDATLHSLMADSLGGLILRVCPVFRVMSAWGAVLEVELVENTLICSGGAQAQTSICSQLLLIRGGRGSPVRFSPGGGGFPGVRFIAGSETEYSRKLAGSGAQSTDCGEESRSYWKWSSAVGDFTSLSVSQEAFCPVPRRDP